MLAAGSLKSANNHKVQCESDPSEPQGPGAEHSGARHQTGPAYYVSEPRQRHGNLAPMNNYVSMQQASHADGPDAQDNRSAGSTPTSLGRRANKQQQQQPLAANARARAHLEQTKPTTNGQAPVSAPFTDNAQDRQQLVRVEQLQQQLHCDCNTSNNGTNIYQSAGRSHQRTLSTSKSGNPSVVTPNDGANGVPFHSSGTVSSKTSAVLNNTGQQQNNNNNNNNNYNHNCNSHNNATTISTVAMPNAIANATHHQRASSESWSRQHQQMAAALQQQHQQSQAITNSNNKDSTGPPQYQQIHRHQQQPIYGRLQVKAGHQSIKTLPYNNNTIDPLDQHHKANTENCFYDEIQPHQHLQGDDLEQYYSRNLHLLDRQLQQAQLSPEFDLDHQIYLHQNNYTDCAHMSAPLQRRYKWPKQQYQYLNTTTNKHSPTNEQLSPPFHINQSQAQFKSATPKVFDINNYNRSYSFEAGSRRKSSGAKSKNPLTAIFRPSSPTTTNFKHHSNTIHLSSSKSHQTLGANSASQRSCPGGGSLKRIKSSPLTAQQASYEAMRTIDMYLIRQIARSCMVSSGFPLSVCLFRPVAFCLDLARKELVKRARGISGGEPFVSGFGLA